MRHLKIALALIAPLLLGGCFMSDKPLITEADSVTPIVPGKYVATAANPSADESNGQGLVTIDGKKTIIGDAEKPDTPPEVYLLREVRAPYFAMVEVPAKPSKDGYWYWLVRVDDKGFTMFESSHDCQALETLAASEKTPVAKYGVVRVKAGNSKGRKRFDGDSCYFDSFETLTKSFLALLDSAHFVPASFVRRVQ